MSSSGILSRLRRRYAFVPAIMIVAVALGVTVVGATANPSWSMSGQGITNWRSQPNENKINADNAGSLSQKWVASLAGDISATPAVVDGAVYVPDWGGKISRLDANTGAVIWQDDIATLTGVAGAKSRTSPAVSGNLVVFGTQKGALLIAVNKDTGAEVWQTALGQVAPSVTNPYAIVTQSPTIYNGVVYVGVASTEENGVNCGDGTSANPAPGVCTFRGSANALDLATGQVLWKTYTISDAAYAQAYRGVSIWGSSPAIDVNRGSVYFTTGNNYSVSQAASNCVTTAGTDLAAIAACEPQGNGNNVDAILSLDMTTGAIKWSNKMQGFDAWTTACIGFPTACPTPAGPDFDFAQGAMLIPTKTGDIVAAGQKSGMLWGLNADTGAKVWGTLVGPGSSLGGLEWGSATDGKRIYFAVVNLYGIPYPMVNPPKGTPTSANAGSWGAADPATGKVLWQTADPNGAIDLGPVSTANGVVYASSFGGYVGVPGSSAGKPTMFALDAANGKQLWSFVSGGSVNAGPAIVNGQLFWGSGYSNLGLGDPNAKLFSFSR